MTVSVEIERSLPIELRDGTVTYGDVYRPPGEAVPAILQRTPYRKDLGAVAFLTLDPLRAIEEGFALVVQDVRGRHSSQGDFVPFFQEVDDGFDSIEWCAAQPWCSGDVGTIGASYAGINQLLAAIAQPPHLRCMVPMLASSDLYEGWTYQGGALQWGFMVGWVLPMLAAERAVQPTTPAHVRTELIRLIDDLPSTWLRQPDELPFLEELAPYFREWLNHPTHDDYWAEVAIGGHYPAVAVPSLNVGGWYDIFKDGTLRNFTGLRSLAGTEAARSGTQLLMGPWSHSVPTGAAVGVEDFGLASSQHVSPLGYDVEREYLAFFKRWLLGDDSESWPEPVKFFTMGSNSWRQAAAWPPPGVADKTYFLHSAGAANTRAGDGTLMAAPPGDEPPDRFFFDVESPVPTRGGDLCCYPSKLPPGPLDQRDLEDREDVLVYVSEPLDSPLEIVGQVRLELWAATSAVDTDFTAKLVKIQTCGRTLNLTDGVLRASFRDGLNGAADITPDAPHCYEIVLGSTSVALRPGEQFALEISSSNYPRFALNPAGSAQQQVFHDALRPSRLLLPVLTEFGPV